MKALKITGWVVLGITGFAGIVAFVSWILTLLWNWLMPGIFGLPEISMLQAAGLFILSKMLFTPGMGGNKGGTSKSHHHHSQDHNVWKRKFMNKMESHCGDDMKATDIHSHSEPSAL